MHGDTDSSKKYLVKTDVYCDYNRIGLTNEDFTEFLRIVKKGVKNVIREHFTDAE